LVFSLSDYYQPKLHTYLTTDSKEVNNPKETNAVVASKEQSDTVAISEEEAKKVEESKKSEEEKKAEEKEEEAKKPISTDFFKF
jgi:hypothetical protein